MRRRDFMTVLAGAVAYPLAVRAQQKAMPVIGVLMGGSSSAEATKLGVFRDALKQLGYVEGQTILIEPSYGEGYPDRLPMLARDMVARAPAVIVCVGGQEAAALQGVTRAIPIVFMQTGNPVEMGLVATLARPGSNITGFSQMGAELDPKRLELLREIAPAVSRVVYLTDPILDTVVAERFAIAAAAAKTLGIALRRLDASTPAELDAALATIDASDGALLVRSDPLLTGTEGARVRDFAIAHQLPAIFGSKVNAVRGGLLSYGPDLNQNYRGAASYVDKILRGAKPADLPVQQPTKFELVINLKTAKALGLTVPQSLLARADEVIE
jgi:putative tryptophan/tyrosine transport system substrate-binding protein